MPHALHNLTNVPLLSHCGIKQPTDLHFTDDQHWLRTPVGELAHQRVDVQVGLPELGAGAVPTDNLFPCCDE